MIGQAIEIMGPVTMKSLIPSLFLFTLSLVRVPYRPQRCWLQHYLYFGDGIIILATFFLSCVKNDLGSPKYRSPITPIGNQHLKVWDSNLSPTQPVSSIRDQHRDHRHLWEKRKHPPRSCTKILMARIKIEVLMFLILFDLFFQMQEKSRRSISKKGRNARFLKIVK